MIDTTDARHVYYIFRAMHDGACPACGYSCESFREGDSLVCGNCLFTLSGNECRGIESLTPRVLSVRLEALERCRKELREIGAQQEKIHGL